jgi:hypothetical protein
MCQATQDLEVQNTTNSEHAAQAAKASDEYVRFLVFRDALHPY